MLPLLEHFVRDRVAEHVPAGVQVESRARTSPSEVSRMSSVAVTSRQVPLSGKS